MGEPLANYANLMKAVTIINAPWGIGLGARHITISTSGLAPQIKQLAEQPLQVRLAISLHGATDEVRQQIMPVNRKYPLAALLEAANSIPSGKSSGSPSSTSHRGGQRPSRGRPGARECRPQGEGESELHPLQPGRRPGVEAPGRGPAGCFYGHFGSGTHPRDDPPGKGARYCRRLRQLRRQTMPDSPEKIALQTSGRTVTKTHMAEPDEPDKIWTNTIGNVSSSTGP